MDVHQLTERLTTMREEAHQLSKAELANADGRAERTTNARTLKNLLDRLQDDIDAAPEGQRATLNDLWQAVNRYLVLPLMNEGTDMESTVLSEAQTLHNDIIAAAKQLAAGKLTDADLKHHMADYKQRYEALINQPGRDEDVNRIISDIILDRTYLANKGEAPSSVTLANAVRDLRTR